MPDPIRLLRTLEQAVEAFRSTPGRTGRLVVPTDVEEVLVVGDLHGNVANFRRALELAQLHKHPGRHLVVQELVHGSWRYAGGGDKSHQLMDLLAALKCQYPRQVHMLLGNHELAQWTCEPIAKTEEDLNTLFCQGVDTAYGPHARDIYKAYHRLFAIIPLAVRTPNRVFISHSLPSAARLGKFDPAALTRAPSPHEELHAGGSVHALVWGRNTSAQHVARFLQKVEADYLITGHIPCERGYEVPNDRQIILDAMDEPACYCLFPTNHSLTQKELVGCIGTLH
jgi:hypothetical protein